jgi:hypothetical protein
MYPQRELTQLAAHKAALRRNIAVQRTQFAEAAARVAQPLEWFERALAFWRRLAPLAQAAAVPLGLLASRKAWPRRKILGSVLRWGPLVFSIVRGVRAANQTRRGYAKSSNDRS